MGQHHFLAFPIILLSIFASSSSLNGNSGTSNSPQLKDWNSLFDEFKLTYNKVYKSEDEESRAKEAYTVNLAKIEAHNELYSQGRVSYSLGSNNFLDESFSKIGAKLTTYFDAAELNINVNGRVRPVAERLISLPSYVDYSARGVVTAVKEQGACASSWAFAATGTVESIYALKTGTLLELSEQQLVDCSGNDGCDGGSVLRALNYMMVANGLVTEEDYPYRDHEDFCDTIKLTPEKLQVKLKGTGAVMIPKGSINAMRNAVANVGPITVLIHAVESFFLYKGGIYDESNCNPETPNYALLVVGYGVDNQTNESYWKARNSLGSTWGDDGYIRIKIGKNVCGIENFGVYADLDPIALPASANSTSNTILGVATSDFELQTTSDPDLTLNSEFVVSALKSAANQLSNSQSYYLQASGIMNDLKTKYNRKFRVIVGTAYSYSGAYASPNYLVLKQKNRSPAIFITIAQAPDCPIKCGKGPAFFLDDVNPGNFSIVDWDWISMEYAMSNADKQVILDYSALAVMFYTNPSQIAKYISINLQNIYGNYMDAIIGTDYDFTSWYRFTFLFRQKNGQLFDVSMIDC